MITTHRCNYPSCKKIIIQTVAEKVFCIRKKDSKTTFICESCPRRALKEIGIAANPKSIFHIHRLLHEEIEKTRKILPKAAAIKRLLEIHIAVYKIYGDNYPRKM